MTSSDIAERIVEAILAQKLAPSTRLGEQALSILFDCSRTLVREAMTVATPLRQKHSWQNTSAKFSNH